MVHKKYTIKVEQFTISGKYLNWNKGNWTGHWTHALTKVTGPINFIFKLLIYQIIDIKLFNS